MPKRCCGRTAGARWTTRRLPPAAPARRPDGAGRRLRPATITADIARRFPASTVVGIDVSAAVIEGVADRPVNLGLRVADLFDLDPAEGRFDVVHAHQVLQHLADPVAALRRMARLCRPDGIIAVRDVDWLPASRGL